jgi:hypothetical protein
MPNWNEKKKKKKKEKEIIKESIEEEYIQIIEVKIKFGKPTIIFPENIYETKSRQLIFEVGFEFEYFISPENENGKFKINHLSTFISNFNLKVKSDYILEPLFITFSIQKNINLNNILRTIKIEIEKGGNIRFF